MRCYRGRYTDGRFHLCSSTPNEMTLTGRSRHCRRRWPSAATRSRRRCGKLGEEHGAATSPVGTAGVVVRVSYFNAMASRHSRTLLPQGYTPGFRLDVQVSTRPEMSTHVSWAAARAGEVDEGTVRSDDSEDPPLTSVVSVWSRGRLAFVASWTGVGADTLRTV